MKFKNYHLKERYPEGFTSTQPHRPHLEAIESEGKEGIWVGSVSDKKFFKKEDYRFLYELFRELVEKGIEPLTDDLMHKDEISRLEQEIAALREQVRQSAGVLQLLRYEMRPPQVQWYYDWLDRPAIRRALGEEVVRECPPTLEEER